LRHGLRLLQPADVLARRLALPETGNVIEEMDHLIKTYDISFFTLIDASLRNTVTAGNCFWTC